MATVDGKTSIKIDELINNTIISGYVDSLGQLILVSRGGAEIDAGFIGGGGGSGVVESIVEGTAIVVDATDPANPIVSAIIPPETLPVTIINAKGDLIVGSADDTAIRKPIGPDGNVLTADSTAGGGIKWTALRPSMAAISETGTLSANTGTKRVYNDSGVTRTLVAIRATVDTPPSGGTVVVDLKVNGTSVFTSSPKPTIASSGYTNKVTAIDNPTVNDGQYVTIDVVSTTFPAANLTVQWAWI